MALYLEKPNKYSSWFELWGRVPAKLLVYIVEIKDVYRINAKGAAKDLKGHLSVKVEVGSAKAKTNDIAVGVPAVNQVLLLDVSSQDPLTAIDLRVKAGKDSICEAALGKWSGFKLDELEEREVDLKFPVKERTKSSPNDIGSRVLGKLTLRVVLTKAAGGADSPPLWTAAATFPPLSGFTECAFHDSDKHLRKAVKSGDLIVFQESGLPAHLINLHTNSPFSRVGMVLRLPDPYTGRVRPCVLELTANPQRFVDISTEEPSSGVVLFRLWERLHTVQGGNIWLLPLLDAVATDPLHNLNETVQKMLTAPGVLPDKLTPAPSADLLALIQEIGIKDPALYCEVFSAAFCVQLLRMGGKRITEPPIPHSVACPKDPAGQHSHTPVPFFTPASLVAQRDVFGPLIPLRTMIRE